ncbi:hypothetical protein HF086_006067 [Spodoptera exigua]|uniref:Uncharacterized protein n=1 Tax=Spodoptera exigua TaxID=7107 RepID=A0A922MS04_SPOEX|nr:hypothetical protein HF086_006067 [Spodoptera exigua]
MESLPPRYKRKSIEKPPVRPKPAYLRTLFGGAGGGAARRGREGGWARRVRLALAADLLQGRCRAADTAITAINKHFVTVPPVLIFAEYPHTGLKGFSFHHQLHLIFCVALAPAHSGSKT